MTELFINNVLILLLCGATIGTQVYTVRRFTLLLGDIESRMAYLQHDVQVRNIMSVPEPQHAPTTPNKAKKRRPAKKTPAKQAQKKASRAPRKRVLNGANPQVMQ